jgi:formylglycine-generating enzyme required for sulfatase activity
MKAHYLAWFLVVGSAVAVLGRQVDVVVGLERAEEPGGPWVAVPIEAGMLHGGRVNAGRVTNDKGFYRLTGELLPVPSPSPSPTPPPAVLPTFNGVTVNGGVQSAWFGTAWLDGFVITRYEVTGAQWAAVRSWALANGYDIGAGSYAGDDFPVGGISWYDAVKFCNALSEWSGLPAPYRAGGAVYRSGVRDDVEMVGGNGWRLPSEREWEWAARGGTQSGGYTYSGSNTVGAVAWYDQNAGSAQRIGTKLGNELGLYDMSGNVAEWCFDLATVGMTPRRFRGGAYQTLGELSVRSTRRGEQPAAAVNAWMGLRLAKWN